MRRCTGTEDGVEGAAELAGYFLAQAICRVQDGGTLSPLIGHERIVGAASAPHPAPLRGPRPAGRPPQRGAVARWQSTGSGARRPRPRQRARLARERHEALFSRIIDFRRPVRSLEIVIPYRPATSEQELAVHRPKLFAPRGLPEDLAAIVKALFRGIDAHEPGGKTWSRHLDQSV